MKMNFEPGDVENFKNDFNLQKKSLGELALKLESESMDKARKAAGVDVLHGIEENTGRSSEELAALNRRVSELSGALDAERKERRDSDAETRAVSTKQNKKTNRYALISMIIAIIALLLAAFSIFAPLFGFWPPGAYVHGYADGKGYSAEAQSED